jgi:hypothetical protein
MIPSDAVEHLRLRLHREVDRLVDEALDRHEPSPDADDDRPTRVRLLDPFDFRWPVIGSERFENASVFEIPTATTSAQAVLGWTTRDAWGRSRRRAVVFGYSGTDSTPERWYPWTEFVETDDGRFGATIPDPSRPRATLKDGDPLPTGFAGLSVERSDELFESIRKGPSLRLVVDAADEELMVSHGYWVARRRGRVG